MHIHGSVEVGILLAGEQERVFRDWSCRLLPGQVWLASMWEPHGWRVLMPDTQTAYVGFLPGFLSTVTSSLAWMTVFAVPPQDRPQARTPEMCEWVLALGNELRQEMQQQPVGWQDVLRANLVRLLSMLRRTWGYTPSQAQEALDPSHMNRIIPVLEGIAAAPERQLDVREAAESCHMSMRHFSRIFSRTMGISFHQFCLQARLAYVERQLMATDATIAVMADAAGFANTGHLCRSFVKHFGLRPSEYRARFGRKEPMPEP